jgi:hypothetical protein
MQNTRHIKNKAGKWTVVLMSAGLLLIGIGAYANSVLPKSLGSFPNTVAAVIFMAGWLSTAISFFTGVASLRKDKSLIVIIFSVLGMISLIFGLYVILVLNMVLGGTA